MNDTPISERVTRLETLIPAMQDGIARIEEGQTHSQAAQNTILVQMAGMATRLDTVIAERSVWKNPLIYISFLSVIVAAFALVAKN